MYTDHGGQDSAAMIFVVSTERGEVAGSARFFLQFKEKHITQHKHCAVESALETRSGRVHALMGSGLYNHVFTACRGAWLCVLRPISTLHILVLNIPCPIQDWHLQSW